MAELLTALERVRVEAEAIREHEHALDGAMREASRLGGTCRRIASFAGMSSATVHRKLAGRTTPEEAEALVARRAEQASAQLALAKIRLAKRQAALGQEVDADLVGDMDELIREAISAADDL